VKSIVITSNAFYPNIGGIENSLRYLARSYSLQGYAVSVVVSDVNSVSSDVLPAYEMLDGIDILRYNSYSRLPVWFKPVRGLLTAVDMFRIYRRLLKKKQPVLTLSRFHSNTLVAKLAGLNNVTYLLPGVARYQNDPRQLSGRRGFGLLKQKVQFWVHDLIQQLAMRAADQLAVFSENMRKQVESCFRVPPTMQLLKPGVDTARFFPLSKVEQSKLRDELELPTDKTVLLVVGRFVRAKGMRYALTAMGDLPNCHLVLVGGGEEYDSYQKLVTELDIKGCVTFAGVVQDPVSYYQASDLFLMSSVYEPLGQTILEALATALPVVAFKPSKDVVTATAELLGEEEAVFVDELSAKTLADEINGLIAAPETVISLSRASRSVAVQRFSWDSLAKGLLDG